MTAEQMGMLCEVVMHLTICSDEDCGELELHARIAAAHYLVQRCVDGHVPQNYEEIMSLTREFDADRAAGEAIRRAMQRRPDGLE